MAAPTTTATAAVALAEAHRTAQLSRAAKIALATKLFFKTRVDFRDPASIEAWLAFIVPKIIAGNDLSSSFAVAYANKVRGLEVPNVKDGFAFEKATLIGEKQIRTSLAVVGPVALNRQYLETLKKDIDPQAKQAEFNKAQQSAADAVGGAALRHVLNGGRQSIDEGVKADRVALGYIRVTKADPCYFCAMLASRGIVYGPYQGDSFDESDARFIGDGNVKVHDHCSCDLKPCYSEDDPMLEQSDSWRELWEDMEHRGGARDILQFRQRYEGREVTAA